MFHAPHWAKRRVAGRIAPQFPRHIYSAAGGDGSGGGGVGFSGGGGGANASVHTA